jgi:hypothetical protein
LQSGLLDRGFEASEVLALDVRSDSADLVDLLHATTDRERLALIVEEAA